MHTGTYENNTSGIKACSHPPFEYHKLHDLKRNLELGRLIEQIRAQSFVQLSAHIAGGMRLG